MSMTKLGDMKLITEHNTKEGKQAHLGINKQGNQLERPARTPFPYFR